MNDTQHSLMIGAIKSGVSAACGMILALNIIDPTKFSIGTLGGWGHLAEAIFITIVVAEARYFKQWADSGNQ